MSGGTPPPGWYDDPVGTAGQRWWTGLGWSEHTSAPIPVQGAPAGLDAPPAGTPAAAASRADDLAGSWSVPGTGEAILRPGADDPMLRGYGAAHADTYRPWTASIVGFAAALLALFLGRPDFALVFAGIGVVPLFLLPGRFASRWRAVGVARHAAVKEGRRPGSRPSERMVTWRELVLALVVVVLMAALVLAFWRLVDAAG